MKKLIVVFAMLLIAPVRKTTGDEQKFKVTFSISFDAMTLSQAAEIEKSIRSKFEKYKSCAIETVISSNKPIESTTRQDWRFDLNGGIGTFNLDSTFFKGK
jgi:hypothetical protein